MDEEDKPHFLKVVALGCGESVSIGSGADSPLDELIGLARMADRYQMEASGRCGGGRDGSADRGELRAHFDDGL